MAFSKEVVSLIKATAPILEVHGETLTRHFYKRMFKHNPEVLPLFNAANQHAGKQQRALAAAVLAYAQNIDNLGVLGGAVELIAHKHVALQILPEHYPIVGTNLLASIKEVLGDGATPDILSAWGVAYGALADILIAREKQLYDSAEAQPNGWRGFRKFEVTKKINEAKNVKSFVIKPVDGKKVPMFKPGQYLTVRVPTEDGSTTMRTYSISHTTDGKTYRITVKKDDGVATAAPGDAPVPGYVSTHLHEKVKVGDELEIAPPCGEFTYPAARCPVTGMQAKQRPVLFLAAGVGVTPIMTMLHTAAATVPSATPITFFHSVSDPDAHPLKAEADALAKGHRNVNVKYFYSAAPAGKKLPAKSAAGLLTGDALKALPKGVVAKDCDVYMCGPQPFMAEMNAALTALGVPASQIHYEFFGPLESLKCPFKHAAVAPAV